MAMPKRILLIGLLFCGYAVYGIVITLLFWMDTRLQLHLGVFVLPVGISILLGKENSRWWARFCLIVGYCLAAWVPIWWLAYLAIARARAGEGAAVEYLAPQAQVQTWMLWAMTFALTLICIHAALYSDKANAYYQSLRKMENPE